MYDQVVGFHLTARFGYDPVHNVRLLAARGMKAPLAWLALAVLALVVWQRMRVIVPPALWALGSALVLVRLQPLQPNHQVLLMPPFALIAALAPLVATRAGEERPVRIARTPEPEPEPLRARSSPSPCSAPASTSYKPCTHPNGVWPPTGRWGRWPSPAAFARCSRRPGH